MCRVWRRGDVHTGFWWREILAYKEQLGNPTHRIILKRILRTLSKRAFPGLVGSE
jgi:hypothetical protein